MFPSAASERKEQLEECVGGTVSSFHAATSYCVDARGSRPGAKADWWRPPGDLALCLHLAAAIMGDRALFDHPCWSWTER